MLQLPENVLAPYRGDKTAVVTMVLNNGEMHFTGSGALDHNDTYEPEELIFEIGSITKVFTSLLLSVLIEEGKIDPNRPVKDVVQGLQDVPPWITPQTLATHTSGLPRIHVPLWKTLVTSLPDDPYVSFSRDDMINWLQTKTRNSPPRRQRYAYSNLAFGLLGEVLAMAEGRPYTELLHEKIIAPLGLTDTRSVLAEPQQARFMQPYSTKDKPVAAWTFQAIAGAGCLRSTARDLGRFSTAVMNALANPITPLDRAICRSATPLVGLGPRGGKEPVAQCLGWLSLKLGPTAPRMLFHNGGTAGSTCALYICPEKMSAGLVLSNRGVAANLWSGVKLSWSNPHKSMSNFFMRLDKKCQSTQHT